MNLADLDRQLRELAPQVLAALARRYSDFAAVEDAVQEALLAAARQWPSDGVPDNPRGWLITVATRRRIESWRSEQARRAREESAAVDPTPDAPPPSSTDDTLTLLMLCCHPSLTAASQIALTLRAVGGLTTAEIARALLVPEATVGQRISRAKQRIKAAGAQFEAPPPEERADRIDAVARVLYLIFTEGHTASSGRTVHRIELSDEAIRLARQLHRQLPDDGEVAGLLALMLLTDARRAARTDATGALIPLAEQDRSRWDHAAITEGTALITTALTNAPIGPFQLQAAIAAVHDAAGSAADTDWVEILGLYELLQAMAPGPMVELNRAVAIAMVHGPRAGLIALDRVATQPALVDHHRLFAVRAHLFELLGETAEAANAYEEAARRTLSRPEQAYLLARARRSADPTGMNGAHSL